MRKGRERKWDFHKLLFKTSLKEKTYSILQLVISLNGLGFFFFFCSVSFYLVQFFYIEFFNIFRSPVIRKGQEEGENSVPEEGQCGKKKIEQLEIFPKFKDRLRVSRKITQENVGSFMV